MIVIGNTEQTQGANNRQKDTQQDIRLDSLQSAVDTLNAQVRSVESTLVGLEASINDRYSAQTQTLMNALNSQIEALSLSLETSLSTRRISGIDGSFNQLSVSLSATIAELTSRIFTILERANIASADIGAANVSQETVNELNAQNASIYSATINLLSVENFTIQELHAQELRAESLEAGLADIEQGSFDKVETNVLTGKEWHTPISTPDNTELLHISLPKYKGVIQLQTEQDEFNLTVFNDSSITLCQQSIYIYRVERNLNSIDIYLQNVGDTINYRILYIGSETHGDEYSEIVDKTYYRQNISQVQEVVFFDPQNKIIESQELGYLVGLTASVQEQLNGKQPKALETPITVVNNEFHSVEQLLEEIANVINSMVTDDIIYRPDAEALIFPYNSIQYDSETETLTIIGFRVEYRDGTLWLTRA